MTDDEPCITNHESVRAVHRMDRPFPCRRRDQHYASCENDKCRGCVPRTARFGYLCPVCYGRLMDRLPKLAGLVAHLRSIEKPAQPVGERVSTSMERSILMPDTWIAADGLLEAIGAKVIPSTAGIDDAIAHVTTAVNAWAADIDARVNTIEGATQAVILLKRVGVALRRWPDSEAQLRHIPHLQCPSCRKPHLWRRAPERFLDDITVECGTEDCGYSLDWWEWQRTYAPAFEEIERQMKRAAKSSNNPR